MKFVILIHSNPEPWGHPTSDYLEAFQTLPKDQQAQLEREFEAVMTAIESSGELVGGEALADPSSATLFRWDAGERIAVDGPYAESKEHFAGFFMIDVTDRARAEEIAGAFSGPGETVELRPAMWPGGEDQ